MKDTDWKELGVKGRMPEHWLYATGIVSGGNNWADMHSFFDPHTRQYRWLSDMGTSGMTWGSAAREHDYKIGSKQDLGRAIKEIGKVWNLPKKSNVALNKLSQFNPQRLRKRKVQ